jgi:hypothetical protein
MAKIHPELLKQLDAAGSHPVQAVFRLRSPDNPNETLSPDEATKLADSVLARAVGHFGRPVARANVLRNLGVLVVEADAPLLHWLSGQNEIESAVPNKSAD